MFHLHVLSFLWWRVAHRRWTWYTSPKENHKIYHMETCMTSGEESIWNTTRVHYSSSLCMTEMQGSQFETHSRHYWSAKRRSARPYLELERKTIPAVLTRPSPGWMLVSWTSSKQADWLIRGSDVVLTVWSQMLFKIFDCGGREYGTRKLISDRR